MSQHLSVDPDLSNSAKRKPITPTFAGRYCILFGLVFIGITALLASEYNELAYQTFSPPVYIGVGILVGGFLQRRIHRRSAGNRHS